MARSSMAGAASVCGSAALSGGAIRITFLKAPGRAGPGRVGAWESFRSALCPGILEVCGRRSGSPGTSEQPNATGAARMGARQRPRVWLPRRAGQPLLDDDPAGNGAGTCAGFETQGQDGRRAFIAGVADCSGVRPSGAAHLARRVPKGSVKSPLAASGTSCETDRTQGGMGTETGWGGALANRTRASPSRAGRARPGAALVGCRRFGKKTMDAAPLPPRQSANGEIVAHSLGEIRSFLDELKHGSRKYRTIASLSGQIAEAYRGRCVLELLQNAHDALTAATGGDPGQITFVLETEPAPVLLIANSGRAFERRDFKGLCRLGQSPKDPNRNVGNKGLGFRSVLEVASAPEIWSTGASEAGPAFVFRFDPQVRERVADTLAELEAKGLETRSPFDPSERLVDWNEDQLQRYRERLEEEGLDGPGETMEYLSPYDLPLPIGGSNEVVDELLRGGHATVVRLPLDGGRTGNVREAVASVRTQLENLLDVSTTLFLSRLKTLVVAIDGHRRTVRRRADAAETFGEVGCRRRERVAISCSDAGEETAVGARFLVWTRALGGDDPEWAARIGDAVRHLPNKWPDVDSVQVGVAAQEGEESAEGRFVIFLPTEMATGTGAHINAPFFGSLDRRRILFEDEYNRLLLECVVDLSLDVIGDLAAGEPEEASGRAIVDILLIGWRGRRNRRDHAGAAARPGRRPRRSARRTSADSVRR